MHCENVFYITTLRQLNPIYIFVTYLLRKIKIFFKVPLLTKQAGN
jgi:hypothetical protein